jgi:hypothetical protein
MCLLCEAIDELSEHLPSRMLRAERSSSVILAFSKAENVMLSTPSSFSPSLPFPYFPPLSPISRADVAK